MPQNRTFAVTSPFMHGADVSGWQESLNTQLRRWHVGPRGLIKVDGIYGPGTRSATKTVLYGLGIDTRALQYGVTPALRVKVRHRKLDPQERLRRFRRAAWRRRLAAGLGSQVASPLHRIIADSWGWHPGVHDGIDLICDPGATLHAICDGTIVRADAGGWWGLGAHASGGHPVSDGDGIIILRSEVDVGPFRRGFHLCYGHAEKATVKAGDHVRAGQVIGHAGFAVAWHVHFMVNDNPPDARGFVRGVGDRDPKPFVDYARKH